jgi:hypothetical protein
MAQKKQTIVGSTLTPDLLHELGALGKLPPSAANFKPAANWQQSYRIWTCHGYRESGNANVGVIRLDRTAGSNGTFTLKVRQIVSQVDGLIADIEAEIECRADALASPVQWDVRSMFAREDGHEIPELAGGKRGQATANPSRTTCDWCLFELVQRLDYDKDTSLDFDLLEGLDLSKPNQRITYRGVFPTKTRTVDRLHCFAQVGTGILPTEYWLDDNHRLLCVISMNKAYILDDRAHKAVKAPSW